MQMTSAYIVIIVVCIMFALVAALTWLSYKYGRVTVLKEQATANIEVKQESSNELAKTKRLSTNELDSRLSKWMRDDK